MKGGDLATTLPPALPNITGMTFVSNAWYVSDSGALYKGSGGQGCGGTAANGVRIYFDANRSNAIYGAADTVQMPALQLVPQIRY